MKKWTFSEKMLKPWCTAFLISLIYGIVGGIWILFSEPILEKWITNPETFRTAKIASQWLFIVVSAQGLFLLIRHREMAYSRSEETLFRVNRSLRVFSECNKATTWGTDELDLLHKICRILVALGGYRLAWVGYAADDEEKNVTPVAHWGHEAGYLNSLKVSWDESSYGQGPAGSTIRTGHATIVQDIMSNPRFKPWRDMAKTHGFASAISLPIKEGRKTYGALVILAAEADAFDMEEASQLEELAEDLSHRINSIRSKAEQRKTKEEQLFLAKVIHQASEGVLTFDKDTRVQYLNPAWEKICGVIAKDVVGNTLHTLPCARQNDDFYLAIKTVIETGEPISGLFQNQRTDGSRYQTEANISPVTGERSGTGRYVAVIRDVTYEAELKEQLLTAQKMAAIATLVKGISHDFNNILAAIITNSELALDDLQENDELYDYLEIIHKAGGRGKNLVKQIMAISHQGKQDRRPVKLDQIVNECLELLRASLPATIDIRKDIEPNLGLVPADPNQLHQVILNLCTNAADAMEEVGGVLELTLNDITVVSTQDDIHAGLHPGSYLKLTIRDTGHGMKRETLDRIFDPFYTTKGQGKGTGLGLSVAHGIIKSHGGLMTVESEPGQGTEFRIFLPRIYCVDEQSPEKEIAISSDRERILFVDDEPDLVFAGKKILEKMGYEVVTGTDSREALKLFTAKPASFDLMITDQTMPHMTGETLANEVHKIREDLPIILCSGNAPSIASENSTIEARTNNISGFITKPYDRSELSHAIRSLLD